MEDSNTSPVQFRTLGTIARAYSKERSEIAGKLHAAGYSDPNGAPSAKALDEGAAVKAHGETDDIYRWNLDVVRSVGAIP